MLTTNLQIQALADRLAGLPTRVTAKSFQEPWAACWRLLDQADRDAGGKADANAYRKELTAALSSHPERDSLLDQVISKKPGHRTEYSPLADMELMPIQWLWPEWLPRGMLTILGAAPGVGKSFVGMDLCWRLTDYGFFPDGVPVPNPGSNVIYVDAEAVPQILNERAKYYDINRHKLYVMLPDGGDMVDFGQERYREKLIDMVWTLQPDLVIIDSLSSIHSKGQNNVEDIRELLGFLSQLAEAHNIALLLIHHIRKPGGGQMQMFDIDMSDLSGSGHIVAMARVVWGLHTVQTGPESDPNGPRELKMLKTNLGQYAESLGFEFEKRHPDGVILRWLEEAPQKWKESTKSDRVKEWLLEILDENGPMKPADVVELGKEFGFGRSTIYNARSELGSQIKNTEGKNDPANEWALFKG